MKFIIFEALPQEPRFIEHENGFKEYFCTFEYKTTWREHVNGRYKTTAVQYQ